MYYNAMERPYIDHLLTTNGASNKPISGTLGGKFQQGVNPSTQNTQIQKKIKTILEIFYD